MNTLKTHTGFLHRHPGLEIGDGHFVVDCDDWQVAREEHQAIKQLRDESQALLTACKGASNLLKGILFRS